MYCLVLMGYRPHRQGNSSLGKNLSWYSPIGVWLTIALVALVQRELEWLKYWSHGLSLIVDSSIRFDSLSSNLRKFFPFRSDAWKVILHCAIVELQFCLLQKSQDNFQGRIGKTSKLLVSLCYKLHSACISTTSRLIFTN